MPVFGFCYRDGLIVVVVSMSVFGSFYSGGAALAEVVVECVLSFWLFWFSFIRRWNGFVH